MKTKLILIFILLLLSSLSIAQVTKRDIGNTSQRDSGDYFLTYKDIFRHVGGEFDFWSPLGGYLLNFKIENDLGKIYFNANDSRELLVYDDDSHTWDFKYPISLNGVPYTTGGGDVVSTLRNTFTKRNTFDSLNVVKIVSDLPFYKGANTWISTKDAYSLFLGANNDTGISISTSNNVRLYEGLTVDGSITAGDISGDEITANTLSNLAGITSLSDLDVNGDMDIGNAIVTSDINVQKGSVENIGTDDNYGMFFKTNGTQRMRLDTAGNAVLFGDLTANYVKTDNTFVATKVVQGYISTTNAYLNIPHGLSNFHQITNLNFVIQHDSTGGNAICLNSGYNAVTALVTGSICAADSTNIKYFVPNTSTGLIGDTIKVTISYHK